MLGDRNAHDLPAIVSQDDHHIEQPTNWGIVNQENQIGRIPPKVSERRRFRLMIKLLPRGSAIALTGLRIDCLEICTNYLAHRIMNCDTIPRGLYKWQAG